MTRQESAKEFRSIVEQISELEDELHDLDVRFKAMDCLDESDPKYNENEYNQICEDFEAKEELLHSLRG